MSDQEFNDKKEWAVSATLAIAGRNDDPINIPQSCGHTFFFEIIKDPNDVTNELICIKTNEKAKHVELIFNFQKFLESIEQAKLRKSIT